MRPTKSSYSQRSSKSPVDTQSNYYITRQERLSKSPGLTQQLNKRKKFIESVSPEHASEVIKNYIIPLFEHKIKYKSIKAKSPGKDSRFSLSSSKGPVAEEILLSSKLYEKLKRTEESKRRLVEKCGEIQQEAELNAHFERYSENKLIDCEANVKSLCFELGVVQKSVCELNQEVEKLKVEKGVYHEKYLSCQAELSEEKASQEKLKINLDIRLFFDYFS